MNHATEANIKLLAHWYKVIIRAGYDFYIITILATSLYVITTLASICPNALIHYSIIMNDEESLK